MPKRAIDAGNRIFFDELVSVSVSRLRATGAIRLEDRHGIIAFGDKQKLVGVAHTKFPNGGSWSYFRCPKCGARSRKLWLVEDAPRCRRCLETLGVRNRAAYGFGRTERLRARDRRVDKLQAMLEGGPMRFKPVPPNWGNRRLDRRNCLTAALQRARIATRLAQIAYQHQQSSEPQGPSPLHRLQTTHSRNRSNPRPQVALAGQINGGHPNRTRPCPIRSTGSIRECRSANAHDRRTLDAENAAGKRTRLELAD